MKRGNQDRLLLRIKNLCNKKNIFKVMKELNLLVKIIILPFKRSKTKNRNYNKILKSKQLNINFNTKNLNRIT
jgi:hypothetical protein